MTSEFPAQRASNAEKSFHGVITMLTVSLGNWCNDVVELITGPSCKTFGRCTAINVTITPLERCSVLLWQYGLVLDILPISMQAYSKGIVALTDECKIWFTRNTDIAETTQSKMKLPAYVLWYVGTIHGLWAAAKHWHRLIFAFTHKPIKLITNFYLYAFRGDASE